MSQAIDSKLLQLNSMKRATSSSTKKGAPKPLDLRLPPKKFGRARAGPPHDDNFDARPFSFIENDPVTPGFDPITPFEITPPHSPAQSEGSDDVIIDSPAFTPAVQSKFRRSRQKPDPSRGREGEKVAQEIGFTHNDGSQILNIRSNLRLKPLDTNAHHNRLSAEKSSRTSQPNSPEDDVEPFTPFDDIGFEYPAPTTIVKRTSKPKQNTQNILAPGCVPTATTRYVSTELIMPMPTHPTPLSPTMERFLMKMLSEIAPTPASAKFPRNLQDNCDEDFEVPSSHVIDVNQISVVAMEFGSQKMIDISSNVALVEQESDPITDHKLPEETRRYSYMIPIVLNDPESFCACSAMLDSEDDSSSIASSTEGALHPNNILRLEDVVIQVRLTPRPRIRRHGWTFLNIGIPVRTALGIMDSLEKDMVSVGKCKMVLHGDHYWIYTPVRAFTKIYRRKSSNSPPVLSRKASTSPSNFSTARPSMDSSEGSLESEDDLYIPLTEPQFFSTLETRSLKVDLYTEIYAKSESPFEISSPSEGDFTLGFSIREIVVIGESSLRGPEWAITKAQRTKCLARGHMNGEDVMSILSPTNSDPSSSRATTANNTPSPWSPSNSVSATPTNWSQLARSKIRSPQTVIGSPVSMTGTPTLSNYQSLNTIGRKMSDSTPKNATPQQTQYSRKRENSVPRSIFAIAQEENTMANDDGGSWQVRQHSRSRERKASMDNYNLEHKFGGNNNGNIDGVKKKKKWSAKFF